MSREIDAPKCLCCECADDVCELRRPLIGWVESSTLPEIICSDCLKHWYSGGENDPEKIAKAVWDKRKANGVEVPGE